MTIRTIDKTYKGEYKSSQSRFLSYLMPTKTISGFKEQLLQLKKEYPKASHICYAYRIGFENEEIRAHDDGEPSGSAGKPILNQLYSSQLQNVSLFVVRYYGGTKLGIPGLIEAYKEAAIQCLQQAEIIEDEEEYFLTLQLETFKYYEVIKALKNNNINILNSDFTTGKYMVKISLPRSKKQWLEMILSSYS
ncbi:MAG: YigZ family protein [Chitinophagales bacterium]|nr:YigZ family protein [Chitinophagales bacterium]